MLGPRRHGHGPEKQDELAREPGCQRDANQAKQEQSHQSSHSRVAAAQSGQVVDHFHRTLRRAEIGQDPNLLIVRRTHDRDIEKALGVEA